MGVEVVGDWVVWQGNHVSGAGVSSGIDMALSLTDRVHGREVAESLQLAIEYDPQPPFSCDRRPKPPPARAASHSASSWATVPRDISPKPADRPWARGSAAPDARFPPDVKVSTRSNYPPTES